VLLAGGLAALGLSPNPLAYLFAWIIVGAGMGAGLYDSAFGTLGRYYGESARSAVATLTLFGGFASTVCWPLTAWLVETFGWRGACLAYAGLHLGLALPAYLLFLPNPETAPSTSAGEEATSEGSPLPEGRRVAFLILAAIVTIASGVTAVISVHLLAILESRGLTLAAAVALGALVGPSQVGARAVEMALGRWYHPIWTLIAAMVLMTAGISLLALDLPLPAVALLFYGAGIGIKSIARGTVPLALFGGRGYATVIGRLAMPSLVAQALAPFLAAFLLRASGADAMLWVLVGSCGLTVLLAAVLRQIAAPRLNG
jgi:hypothetical protein